MAKKRAPQKITFEEALAQLETIVQALEDGQIGLEEALAKYEEGALILKRCTAELEQAEQRIQLLTGPDEKGQPTLKPFRHEATFRPDSGADAD